jgi:hypothetical protein
MRAVTGHLPQSNKVQKEVSTREKVYDMEVFPGNLRQRTF